MCPSNDILLCIVQQMFCRFRVTAGLVGLKLKLGCPYRMAGTSRLPVQQLTERIRTGCPYYIHNFPQNRPVCHIMRKVQVQAITNTTLLTDDDKIIENTELKSRNSKTRRRK